MQCLNKYSVIVILVSFILQPGNAFQSGHDLYVRMLMEMRSAGDIWDDFSQSAQQVNVPSPQVAQRSAGNGLTTPENRSDSLVTASPGVFSQSDSPAMHAPATTVSADTGPFSDVSAPSSRANNDSTSNDLTIPYYGVTEDTQRSHAVPSIQNLEIIIQSGHQNGRTPEQSQTSSPASEQSALLSSGRQKRKAPADFTSQSHLKQQRRSTPITEPGFPSQPRFPLQTGFPSQTQFPSQPGVPPQTGFPSQMHMMYYNADPRGYWGMTYDHTASGHYLQYPAAYSYYPHHYYPNPAMGYPAEADWMNTGAARKAQGAEALHSAPKPHG